MEKFFLISQVFYPDEVSTAGLFTSLASYLSEDQYDVEVWCAQPSYTHTGKQPGKITHLGMQIRYLCSTRIHKSKLWGRILNISTFMFSTVLRLLFTRDKTPVFTHTTPPFLGIVLSMICSIKKRKLVYIMLDIFPEGMIRLGKLSAGNVFVRLWKRLFVYSLQRSTRIIVLGRDMGDYIAGIYPGGKDKIEYLPHWQDQRLISPIPLDKHPFIHELDLEGHFIIQYSGNMGLWNDMATFGKAVNLSTGNIRFVFIGGGIRKSELQQNISSDKRDSVVYLPFQPSDKLGEVLTGCHASLVSLREGLEGMAVPSKIYGILAAGIPVLALVPEESEIAYIVKEEKCGYVISPGDVEGLSRAIMKLRSDDLLRKEMGLRARSAFETKYTTRIIAERYKQIIQELG